MELKYGVNNFINVSLPLEKVYHDATLFGDGTKQKPLRVIGGGGGGTSLPTMTGNSGKFLTTNGTVASWAVVNALPTQTGNSGKILSTNGTVASWIAVPTELPTLGTSLQVLRVNTDGSALEYATLTSGTVTSVGLTLPSIFTVSGSPVTTSGTLAATLNTQSANLVFAGPNTGSPAAPTFRALVAADIPNLDTSKITTGILAIATGGTGLGTLGTADQILKVNAGASALEYVTTLPTGAIPNLDAAKITTGTIPVARGGTGLTALGTADQVLKVNAVGTALEYGTVSGGGSPAGSNTQIQFNNSGAFGASANLVWDNVNGRLGIAGTPTSRLTIGSTPGSTTIPIVDVTCDTSTVKNAQLMRFTGSAGGSMQFFSNASSGFLPTIQFTSQNVANNNGLGGAFIGITGTDVLGVNGLGVFGIDGRLVAGPLTTANIFSVGSFGNVKMVVSATGNLGLGITSPTSRLHVVGSGSTAATTSLLVLNSGSVETFRVLDDGEIRINKNSTVTTQSSAVIAVQSADTNTNIVLTPKGTGAFILGPAPDGLPTGGNLRGLGATDLQRVRTTAAQVASGLYSIIGGGIDNVASNNYSVVGGGRLNNSSSNESTVSGGLTNTASGVQATVSGGTGNTASASNSTVSGGNSNRASGLQATVSGGESNTANGQYASVSGGAYAIASLYGQQARANGRFSVTGSDAQISSLIFRRAITGISQTELFLDEASAAAILPLPTGLTLARAWNFIVNVVGICHAAGGGTTLLNDVYSISYAGCIKRVGSTTSLVGAVQTLVAAQSDLSMATSVVLVDANDTNESLRIRVTPPSTADGTTVTRWVAKVELVEVGR